MLEHIPLIAFGLTYYFKGLLPATAVIVVASIVVIPLLWKKTGEMPKMHIFTAILLGVMGGATLFSGNSDFIKMKPTVASIIFAGVIMISVILNRNVLKALLSNAIELPNRAWNTLAYNKVAFFVMMGAANEYVWRNFTESQWVQFKLFGFTLAYIVFMIVHIPFVKKNGRFKG